MCETRVTIIAGQGVDRATVFEDEGTASALKELQTGFRLTYETLSPRMQAAEAISQPAQPTRTESLPPMTSAKGVDKPLQTQNRPAQAATAQPVTPGEGEQTGQAGAQAQQEETFSSFLRQRRADANLTQKALGQRAGNLQNTLISQMENGILPADVTKITQVVEALGLSEEDKQKMLALYEQHTRKNNPPAPQQ